jgi:hypothetical protein
MYVDIQMKEYRMTQKYARYRFSTIVLVEGAFAMHVIDGKETMLFCAMNHGALSFQVQNFPVSLHWSWLTW